MVYSKYYINQFMKLERFDIPSYLSHHPRIPERYIYFLQNVSTLRITINCGRNYVKFVILTKEKVEVPSAVYFCLFCEAQLHINNMH